MQGMADDRNSVVVTGYGTTEVRRDVPPDHGQHVCLCGAEVHALSMSQVLERVERAVSRDAHLNISVVNVAKLVNMRRDALLRASVLSGDLVLADGMPLVWLSRLRRRPLPERVAGIDLMYRLFELANQRHLRVFLLGATQEIIERVVAIARERYPGMVIAGYRNGYFSKDQEAEVADQIGASAADILLVAMTSPRKELFMERWGQTMHAAVCHGVGGSFDVMAGLVRRAPRWMQRCGLEWLFRVLQEPRRLWKRYFYTNVMFLRLGFRCLICGKQHGEPGRCPWQPACHQHEQTRPEWNREPESSADSSRAR